MSEEPKKFDPPSKRRFEEVDIISSPLALDHPPTVGSIKTNP